MAEPDDKTNVSDADANVSASGATPVAMRMAGAPLRRTAIVETIGTLAIFVLVDYLFLEGDGYRLFAPHPYWLVVVFVATQYGTREGLFAAALSSVALYAGGIPEQRITQDLYTYLFELAQLPLYWSAAAVLLGELRMRHVRERETLRAELADTTERANMIAAAYEGLQATASRLEIRIAGQLRTVVTMYRAARAVESMEPGQVLTGAIENVQAVINPQKCSIYLLADNGLEAAIQRGWARRERIKRVFGPDTALYKAIVDENRVVCVADPDDEVVLAGQGILAGPLVNTETGNVHGMIKIEDIGFPELNQSTIAIFDVMCEWVGAFYTNAQRYQRAAEQQAVDVETELYAGTFYPRIERVLGAIARRAGYPMTAVTLRLDDPYAMNRTERHLVARTLGDVVKAGLRNTDMAFDYGEDGWEFVLILSLTDGENAEMVTRRTLAAFKAALPEELADIPISHSINPLVALDDGRRDAPAAP